MKWRYLGDDVAYLKFREIEEDGVKESVHILGTGLVLDFDDENRLVGIESYRASQDLPRDILDGFPDQDSD